MDAKEIIDGWMDDLERGQLERERERGERGNG